MCLFVFYVYGRFVCIYVLIFRPGGGGARL